MVVQVFALVYLWVFTSLSEIIHIVTNDQQILVKKNVNNCFNIDRIANEFDIKERSLNYSKVLSVLVVQSKQNNSLY